LGDTAFTAKLSHPNCQRWNRALAEDQQFEQTSGGRIEIRINLFRSFTQTGISVRGYPEPFGWVALDNHMVTVQGHINEPRSRRLRGCVNVDRALWNVPLEKSLQFVRMRSRWTIHRSFTS